MIPSVWTGYYETLPVTEAVLRLKKAGFDHGELCFDHAEAILEKGDGAQVRGFLQNEGFALTQGHLSFVPTLCGEGAVDLLKRQLELFDLLGIRNAVLHFSGGKNLPDKERFELRLERLGRLQEFVKGSELYLCLENLPSVPETYTAGQLLRIMELAGGENLGICLDTGHLHLVNGRGEAEQSQREFILTAGRHLRAMHVTENNGKNDVHQMPYSARYGVDWQEVVTSLKEIGYKGLFNLEILGERNAPEPIKTAKLRFIREMTGYMLED